MILSTERETKSQSFHELFEDNDRTTQNTMVSRELLFKKKLKYSKKHDVSTAFRRKWQAQGQRTP